MGSERAVVTGESIERQYPKRPFASVAACVLKGERILVIKRATQPSKGLWSVPGGVVELGETIQDTAKRELNEECGIEIEVGEVFNVENLIVPDERGRVQFHYVVTYLIAHYVSGEAHPDSDAQEVRWATPEELENLDMNPVVRKNMLKAFEIGGS
jgi:ADP-ribose pyrophosphatase YjhB (NUDIX family)